MLFSSCLIGDKEDGVIRSKIPLDVDDPSLKTRGEVIPFNVMHPIFNFHTDWTSTSSTWTTPSSGGIAHAGKLVLYTRASPTIRVGKLDLCLLLWGMMRCARGSGLIWG